MPLSFIEQFQAARRVSTPDIFICTPDIESTIKAIALHKNNAGAPIALWDCMRGLTAVNEPQGKAMVQTVCGGQKGDSLKDPADMLVAALKMPKESILFMANLQMFIRSEFVIQALWNTRDAFKTNTRTLVGLGPDIKLPKEIASDVLVLNEPLPDEKQLEQIVLDTYSAVSQPKPKDEILSRAKDALCGLAAFPAEQVCAMSIRTTGLDLDQLWERKRQQIEQTGGLSVWRGPQKFEDIGGCDNIKTFLTRVMNGKDRPRAVIFQDEIEKQFAGAGGGDLSGITQELLGNQLSFMQDNNATGIILIGHAGVAKSDIAKAFGNEAGIPTIQLDLGGAKGSLVGESNANMRNILKVIQAVSQDKSIWICTSNNIENLPPELRRRYSFGTFFFDLPTPAERALIWNIYFKKFNLTDRKKPWDSGWTGAEIKNCCLLSHRLEIPLEEAAKLIVPLSVSASDRIAKLRNDADGRYITAAAPGGVYRKPEGADEPQEDTTTTLVAVAEVKSKPRRKMDIEPDTKKKPN